MDLDAFVDRLEGVRRRGGGYVSRCPSHDDREASLGITEGDEGVLVKCYAGCETKDVLAALGLTFRDLFRGTSSSRDRDEPEAVYSYVDENGGELYQAVRFPGKRFRQRHMEDGEWVWNLDGVRRVVYGLPEVIAAVAEGRTIYICEGEKDVGSLRAAGHVATCNPMGAGKWRVEYNAFFAGANVIIVADRDEPGRNHAEHVRSELQSVGASVWIVQAKQGKDATDHLEAGFTAQQFVPLRKSVRRGIITAGEMAEAAIDDLSLSPSDTPGFVFCSAIPLTFRLGRMYTIGAYTGDGKTSFAQQGARKLCEEGRRGSYFSLEMPERDLRNRFLMHEGLPLRLLEEPWRMSSQQRDAYLDGAERFKGWNLDIIFDTSLNAKKVAEIVRDRESEFVIVDHVHRFSWGERRHFDEEVLTLTNIALEQNVMLLLLCQLRKTMRGRDIEAFPRPTIQDFRETSQLADDSSIALAVWRQRDAAGLRYMGPTQAIVLKNRHTTGRLDEAGREFFVSFDQERGIFTESTNTTHDDLVYHQLHTEGDAADGSWIPA